MDAILGAIYRKAAQQKSTNGHRSAWFRLVLFCALQAQICYAYDMKAVDVSNTSYYKELTRRNILVVDEVHNPLRSTQRLEQRQTYSNESKPSETTIPSLDTDTGLPVPFDTSLGSNFTDSACPQYFTKFLTDSTFLSCLPMSLLLQNSMSFFQAARSTELLRKTIDESCSASLAVCSPLMAQFAEELISPLYCEKDYLQENPLVMQAYAGLNAYEPLYQASCLRANSTGEYCFVEAMDSSSADDTYPYYTAVGLQLPAGSKPSCSSCLHETMEIFSGYAVQKSQALSQTYLGCAIQVNQECGASFASTQVKGVSKVKGTNTAAVAQINLFTMLAALIITLFLV